MENYIKINGLWIPTPDTYNWKISDLDLEAKRNNAGTVIRRRVRENVNSLDYEWTHVDQQKFHEFIKIMKQLPPEFDMTFLDGSGEWLTRRMYRADVSAQAYMFDRVNSYWQNCKTSFVEI